VGRFSMAEEAGLGIFYFLRAPNSQLAQREVRRASQPAIYQFKNSRDGKEGFNYLEVWKGNHGLYLHSDIILACPMPLSLACWAGQKHALESTNSTVRKIKSSLRFGCGATCVHALLRSFARLSVRHHIRTEEQMIG
jgi:hypothetical protein